MKSHLIPSFALSTLLLVLPQVARSQIIPDHTLGAEGSVVHGSQISGGAIRGSNLFHSFQEFGIPAGAAAYFANPAGITDIFGRVTGGNPSEIFGTLGVEGDANLTLINPQGFLFGENAQLDIRGSFMATTSSVTFNNGYEFSATNPTAPPLLNIGVPLGLQRGTNPTGGTIINEATLEMQLGEEVIFFAEEVRHGGEIVAPGGAVKLVGQRVALVDDAVVNVSNPDGDGGTARIGGAWQGLGDLPTAQRTYVGKDVRILANGGTVGDGGEVVVWADEVAAFYGGIESRGGDVAGDGGDVEVSGKGFLDFRGVVDTSAVSGVGGRLLLDPTTVEIVPLGGAVSAISNVDQFIDPDVPFGSTVTTIDSGVINAQTTDFEIQAQQDIIFNTLVTIASGVSLTATAMNDIEVNDEIKTDQGNITLDAGRNILINKELNTGGSDIELIAGGYIDINDKLDSKRNTFPQVSGNVTITANGDITTRDIFTRLFLTSQPTGSIKIVSTNGSIDTSLGSIDTTSLLNDSGDVEITANGDVKTGKITTNVGSTESGDIIIRANGNIQTDDIESISGLSSTLSSTIEITSYEGSINASTGNIIARSLGVEGGTISVKAKDDVVLSGLIDSSSKNQSGSIDIESEDGSIQSNILAINSGNLGKRAVSVLEAFGVDPSLIPVPNTLNTSAGDISLRAGQNINLRQTAVVGSGRSLIDPSIGASGQIKLETLRTGSIILDNAYLRSNSDQGIGSDMIFETGSLTLKNQATAIVRTANTAQPGNITVTAPEFVQLSDSSFIELQNRSDRVNGDVIIAPTQRLTLNSGAALSASTISKFKTGRGGLVDVTANLVEISGADSTGLVPSAIYSISSQQLNDTSADAGDIRIRADQLEMRGGGTIFAAASGTGKGGNVDIEANTVVVQGTTPSQLVSSGISTDSYSTGQAGNIKLSAQTLRVEDGGSISSSTFRDSSGGNIEIQADSTTIRGTSKNGQVRSGIYAQSFNAGDGGNITLNSDNLVLNDRAKVTVSSDPFSPDSQFLARRSQQLVDALRSIPDSDIPATFSVLTGLNSGGDAGNLVVNAEHIFLDNLSEIIAETTSGEGGNILLNALCYILLRHNSQISTTAGGTGRGGNIDINTSFLVAPPSENSDITANAFAGPGGSVDITAFAIYGLEFRPQLTALSDITVTSTFNVDGEFVFNPLTLIDPTSDLNRTETNPDNPEIDNTCQTAQSGGEQSSFINSGAGGLQSGPEQVGRVTSIDLPWIEIGEDAPGDETQPTVAAKMIDLNTCGV